MGHKCKLIIAIILALLVFLVLLVFVVINSTGLKKDENYSAMLVSVLKEQEAISVQDVFSFEFHRAYVFNDCYISGEGFVKKYNLNISINDVKSGVSENIQRIVFVNESGNFVYEFKCDNNEVSFPETGMIIYPETIIEKNSFTQEKPLIISFQSSEYYDSKR